jgi:large subunit ribosomal protein L23
VIGTRNKQPYFSVNIKGKTKRFGGRLGKRSDLRKAYVTLGPGHDIDFVATH